MNEFYNKFINQNELKIFNINPYSLRGENFFKTIFEYRKKIFSREKKRIKKKKEFFCNLCKSKKGNIFLTWKKNYQLILCQRCEAVSPNISFQDEKKFIKSVYDDKDYLKKTFRYIFKNYNYRKKMFGSERYEYCVKRLKLKKNSRVLDVGCGMAYFVNYLKSKKVYCKGLEPTKAIAEFCKSKLKLNVSSNSIDEEKNNSYDLITMFDVVEHLKDPVKYLKVINKKLKKNSYCVMYTPNIHSFAYALMGSNQNGILPFEHLCFFNKKSLEYLSKKTNFKVDKVETFGWDIMDYITFNEFKNKKKFYKYFGDFAKLLQPVLDKSGLSNHMRITFKKK